jgi:hypothetical protein
MAELDETCEAATLEMSEKRPGGCEADQFGACAFVVR